MKLKIKLKQHQIKSIKYKKDFQRIRFDSNDNLPLGKILTITVLSIVVKSVFHNGNKYYP